jgi:hypothetical protein
MKRWVDFELGEGGAVVRGFEGARKPVPIDKLAEFVLAYYTPENGIRVVQITITYTIEDGPETSPLLPWRVVATSETHVGVHGNYSRIDGSTEEAS